MELEKIIEKEIKFIEKRYIKFHIKITRIRGNIKVLSGLKMENYKIILDSDVSESQLFLETDNGDVSYKILL